MIEALASLVDLSLHGVSGKVFYSGRAAFASSGGIYVLGFNPGGDPQDEAERTVGAHTKFVLTEAPPEWSAYTDERWQGRLPGTAPLQRRVVYLLGVLGLDPRLVPSSNLIFTRSRRGAHLGTGAKSLIEVCWPFQEAVLSGLKPTAIVCLGTDTGERVRRRVGATELVGTFMEKNERGWVSRAWRAPDSLLVFSLTHPGIVDWTAPETDPSPMVRAVMQG